MAKYLNIFEWPSKRMRYIRMFRLSSFTGTKPYWTMWKLNNSNYTNGQLNKSWFTKKWIEQKHTEQGPINQIGNCPTCSFNKYQLPIIYPVVNWTGTNWTILSPSPLSVEAGLAQISRAYGQRAKSQTRARKKIITSLTPMAWIHCGLDQLWFGSIVV